MNKYMEHGKKCVQNFKIHLRLFLNFLHSHNVQKHDLSLSGDLQGCPPYSYSSADSAVY